MAPSSSSSTKKAAKLAQSGSGPRVRFQGGTLFPLVVTLVIVLGLALVVYARQSRPSVDASGAPLVDDHWHHAYGFNLCGEWFSLEGDAEQQGTENYNDYVRTGVHSHDDGLIHWHPFTSAAVGSNARLGVFLDTYGVELADDGIEFPETQEPALRAALSERDDVLLWENGETTCTVDGAEEDASLKVVVWNNFTDTDDGTTYIADFDNIRLDKDQMVIVMAFVPDGTDIVMPPWAPDLPSLGLVDSGQLAPDSSIAPNDVSELAPADTTDAPDSTETPDTPAPTDTSGG